MSSTKVIKTSNAPDPVGPYNQAIKAGNFIYCAHEYTKSNLLWALDIEPKNQNIKKKLIEVEKKIALKELTIPCLLEEEMKINLFLRADNLKGFSLLRAKKDTWV